MKDGLAPRPHALVAADVVALSLREGCLQVLLVARAIAPFRGRWALPGGFVRPDETVEAAAQRELHEETGLAAPPLGLLGVFSEPARDPRGRVMSVAFLAALGPERAAEAVCGGSDARAAAWWPLDVVRPVDGAAPPEGLVLAFDHGAILDAARRHAQEALHDPRWPLQLLPREFTLAEAQSAQEALLGAPIDRVTFRRRLLALGLVRETPRWRRGAHRPARLFTLCAGERIGPRGSY